MRAGARAGEGRRGGGGGAARSRSGAARGHGRLAAAAAGLALSPLSPSLARSFGAASRWQGRGTDRLSQRDGGAHAAHSTLGSCRPPGPAPPTGGRSGGRGGGEGGRCGGEGGRERARGAARAPRDPGPGYSPGPAMSAPAPPPGRGNGGDKAVPAGVLALAVASLSRWEGGGDWIEPGGSAARSLRGGLSCWGDGVVARAWFGSLTGRVPGQGARLGRGAAGAGVKAVLASMFTLKNAV